MTQLFARAVEITLIGPPVSINRLYSSTGRQKFMTKEGKERKEDYAWQVRSQYRGEPITESVEVDLVFYFKDKRIRDVDNVAKMVLDALSNIVITDDSQIQDLHLHKRYDPVRPRTEIKLSTYPA